jgi:hypothetical protein
MTATKGKGPQSDYPEEYARQKSIYGCILCDKTHRKEECEHKAKRTYKPKEQVSWYD